jgi:hypothetical protein
MIFLATRGWKCRGLDNWKAAVARASAAAGRYGVADRVLACRAEIGPDGTVRACAGHEAVWDSIATARFALVLCVRYLNRALFPAMRDWVAPGGYTIVSTFVDHSDAPKQARGAAT